MEIFWLEEKKLRKKAIKVAVCSEGISMTLWSSLSLPNCALRNLFCSSLLQWI